MSTTLSDAEKESLLTLALMAAFADGDKGEVERAEIKRMAGSLSGGSVNPAALLQRVLLRQTSLPEVLVPLGTPEARRLAYEMAVCVCEADEQLNEAEKRFLADVRRELRLEEKAVAGFQSEADSLAAAPLAAGAPPPLPGSAPGGADLDRSILNYSILNGALELLPESLATMAIVPLQMKMVYEVGKRYGYELDRRHITELLGAAGVGLTSQVLEGFARKLMGGLLGKVGGGLGRRAGGQLASSAMSFASTYALGQVAVQYYSGGRQLSAIQLQQLFGSLSEQARSLHGRYAGEIQQRAGSLNPSQILQLVRGA